MKSKILLTNFLSEIIKELESLSDTDVKKLENGDYSLNLKVVKKTSSAKNENDLTEEEANIILNVLKECDDRDCGYDILKSKLKNRKKLEQFAKIVDVHIMKQDKIEKIRDKIIEGIIGASLRSTVIQRQET